MNRITSYLIILPVFLICYFLYKMDRNKEPKKLLIKLFFCGLLSCIITVVINILTMIFIPFFAKETTELNLISLIPYVFLGIALVEEFSKWIIIYLFSFNDKEFDETYDMVIYSVYVSLGFATLENVLYIMQSNILVALFRAVTAVPGHAFNAVFIGYYLALAKKSKINNDGNYLKYMLLSIIVPTIMHGIYDYLAIAGKTLFMILFFIFVIIEYIICIRLMRKTARENEYFINHICSNCGSRVEMNYCSNCGRKYEGN